MYYFKIGKKFPAHLTKQGKPKIRHAVFDLLDTWYEHQSEMW